MGIQLLQLLSLIGVIDHVIATLRSHLKQTIIEHTLHVLVYNFCFLDFLLRLGQRRLHLIPLLQFLLDIFQFGLLLHLVLHDLGLASPSNCTLLH